jgi:hypothetical protein
MKTWTIPVVWQQWGTVTVEANTLAEAVKIALDDDGLIPLPDDNYYVDGSWDVASSDERYLRHFYNRDQEDCVEEVTG